MGFSNSSRREFLTYLLLCVVSFTFINELSAESPRDTPTEFHFGSFDILGITPTGPTEFSGHPGGPFMPTNIFYQLTNNLEMSISWTLTKPMWLDTDSLEGTLEPGEFISLRCWPNSLAATLLEGQYSGLLRFTVPLTQEEFTREINLHVFTEPKIWYGPGSFDVILPFGPNQVELLTIGNSGDDVLNFSLLGEQTNFYSTPAQLSQAETDTTDQTNTDKLDIPDLLGSPVDYGPLEEGAFIPGELLVCFSSGEDNTPINSVEQQAILSELGGGYVVHELNIIPGLCLVKLPEEMSVSEALSAYSQSERFICVSPNFTVQPDAIYPSDNRFFELWGLHNTGQFYGIIDADIDMPEAWEIATGSREIIVGVIDSGVDYTHPDLAANMWINSAEQNGTAGIDDDLNGFIDDIYGYDFPNYNGDPFDELGHGTHVAGTIGAVGNNGLGVTGVCWEVQIMALKFAADGTEASDWSVIRAIDYAILMGANVLNNSWGRQRFPSPFVEAAIVQAGNAGILFVASAGNDNNDNDGSAHYPASYECDNIISVMASSNRDTRSAWAGYASNWGASSVDLSAPGSDILSCDPGGGYLMRDGTSMAAPHVSGAAALVWSANSELNYQGIKDILLKNVDHIHTLNGLNATGGRLNVHNALLATGTSWIDSTPQSGSVNTNQWHQSQITFIGDQTPGVYEGQINVYSNDPFSPIIRIPVTMTVKLVDYYTEHYTDEDNSFSFESITFTPGDKFNYYHACRQFTSAFPVDPAGGTEITLQDDDYVPVILPPGKTFNFYDVEYDTFYVGSNGFLTFQSGDFRYVENLENHFMLPRIAGLFDDLNPTAGGRISWQALDDRVVVTFEDISEFHVSAGNSFQFELFYNSIIRITWLSMAAHDGLVGLSRGEGIPEYFVENDFTRMCDCSDLNCDTIINLIDYSILANYWLDSGCPQLNFWCETSDIDRDGDVDLIDLSYIYMKWLESQEN